jgi:hypothetical protein
MRNCVCEQESCHERVYGEAEVENANPTHTRHTNRARQTIYVNYRAVFKSRTQY